MKKFLKGTLKAALVLTVTFVGVVFVFAEIEEAKLRAEMLDFDY